MNRLLAPAAAALFRALARRAGMAADRTLLAEAETVEWHSLTLSGERHRLCLRLAGPEADQAARALADGIEDADLPLPGDLFVADIGLVGPPSKHPDGSINLTIEALTIGG